MVNWAKLGVGKSFRPHYHQDMEEIFVILRGKSHIRIQEEEAELGKEGVVVTPVGRVHEMKNIGEEEVEYIVIGISQAFDFDSTSERRRSFSFRSSERVWDFRTFLK